MKIINEENLIIIEDSIIKGNLVIIDKYSKHRYLSCNSFDMSQMEFIKHVLCDYYHEGFKLGEISKINEIKNVLKLS